MPPDDIAAYIRCGSRGWTSRVCRQRPPNPGFHFGRSGWLNSAWLRRNVSPRSSERNIAPGSTPASTTSGPIEGAASRVQIEFSASPLPLGNLLLPSAGSFQVAPKSSDRLTIAPQCSLLLPASILGCFPSRKANDHTDSPGKCGPDIRKSFRARSLWNRNAPFEVPTISTTSPLAGEKLPEAVMIALSPTAEPPASN